MVEPESEFDVKYKDELERQIQQLRKKNAEISAPRTSELEAIAFGPEEDFNMLLSQAKNQLIETEQMIEDQE